MAYWKRFMSCSLVAWAATPASAEPIFTDPGAGGEECVFNRAHDGERSSVNGFINGEPITIFVEDDFAAEWRSCGGSLTQAQVERQVQDAMDVWNREANGRLLVWGGTLPIASDADLCNAVRGALPSPTPPAVIVHGHTDPDRRTGAGNVDKCNGVRHVMVKLTSDKTTPESADSHDSCAAKAAPQLKDPWNSDPTIASLAGAMLHELGHILGFGHRHESTSAGDTRKGQSVMSYPDTADPSDPRQYVNNFSDLHLWQWDKDCVDDPGTKDAPDDVSNRRTVTPQWVTFKPDGAYGAIVTGTRDVVKLGRSAGAGRDASGAANFALHLGDAVSVATAVQNVASVVFGAEQAIVSAFDYHIRSMSVAPLFFSVYERAVAKERHRFSVLSVPRLAANVVDPPIARAVSSVDWFEKNTSIEAADFTIKGVPVRTHIPLVATYDPHSGQTIYLRVDTTRTDVTGTDVNKLFLHFAKNRDLSAATDVTAALAGWTSGRAERYQARTMTQPAMACGGEALLPNNCILAWKDAGNTDGDILYVRFGVSVAPTAGVVDKFVVDSKASILSVDGGVARTPGDLSMAFFAKRFHLAFKTYATPQGANHIQVVRSALGEAKLGAEAFQIRPNRFVVGAPSWHGDVTNAKVGALLAWTVAPAVP